MQANNADLSLEGLVLAGMMIGALGVLADVTVSQASTVMALRQANLSRRVDRRSRSRRGNRQHTGAGLRRSLAADPAVFGVGGTPFVHAISREAVAEQVVAMLVGSTGLIVAVPVTTGLAAALAGPLPAGGLDASAGHVH